MSQLGNPVNFVKVFRFVTLALLVGASVLFDVFNFQTTANAFVLVIGSGELMVLAIALALADFASLARVVTDSKNMKDEPEWVKFLMVSWAIVAVVNAFFTYFYMAAIITSRELALPEFLADIAYNWFPIGIAACVLMLRVGLFLALGEYLDTLLHPKKEKVEKAEKQHQLLPDQHAPGSPRYQGREHQDSRTDRPEPRAQQTQFGRNGDERK